MRVLRIDARGAAAWTISLDGRAVEIAPCAPLSAPQWERIRWYFEEFPCFPYDPAPRIAAEVEAEFTRIGEGLFRGIFGSPEGRALWEEAARDLASTRIEIAGPPQTIETLPWELMKDPDAAEAAALGCAAFVRAPLSSAAGVVEAAVADAGGACRILLAISRPAGLGDVAFRSVGRAVLTALAPESSATVVDVLRPPTWDRLQIVLREAARRGQPYHVVHFDGHGTYYRGRGYVLFEDPEEVSNREEVDGAEFGGLLAETGVRAAVLNACRSAHAEPQPGGGGDMAAAAIGSFAQEVALAGVAGVVAMRYNVQLSTAVRFVTRLYAQFAAGVPLGEAVASARRTLAESPNRMRLLVERFVDWPVPVVFEREPLALASAHDPLPDGAASASTEDLFVGRDTEFQTLDRLFEEHSVALLVGWVGDGKTATTRQFAEWRRRTGALTGGMTLYTSFREVRSYQELYEQLQRAIAEKRAVPGRLSRNGLLRLLHEIPLLWIWDDVDCWDEPAEGAPLLGPEERAKTAVFLGELRLRARVLLVSSRPRAAWLSQIVCLPVRMTQMAWWELAEIAAPIVAERPLGFDAGAEAWRPLWSAARGHPLALRDC